VIGLVVGGVILAVFAGWRYAGTASTAVASADIIAQGRQIYADQCAACHGAELEGQPGFADVLSDADIRAVLDYIKSTWPERERRYQERVSEAN